MKMGGLLSYFGTQTNEPIIVGKGDSDDVEEPIPDLLDKIVKHSDTRNEDGTLNIVKLLDQDHIEKVIAENK